MTWLFQQLNKAIMTQGGFFCLSLVEIDNTYAFKQYTNFEFEISILSPYFRIRQKAFCGYIFWQVFDMFRIKPDIPDI
jgi:hypothetical protein